MSSNHGGHGGVCVPNMASAAATSSSSPSFHSSHQQSHSQRDSHSHSHSHPHSHIPAHPSSSSPSPSPSPSSPAASASLRFESRAAPAPSRPRALPLTSVNHLSIRCQDVEESLRFYCDLMGFIPVKRPSSLDGFEGAWLFNYGIGLHLIKNDNVTGARSSCKRSINPSANHISFQCEDLGAVESLLEESGIPFVRTAVMENGITVDQLFFHDPDDHMIEICNCEALPLEPISNGGPSGGIPVNLNSVLHGSTAKLAPCTQAASPVCPRRASQTHAPDQGTARPGVTAAASTPSLPTGAGFGGQSPPAATPGGSLIPASATSGSHAGSHDAAVTRSGTAAAPAAGEPHSKGLAHPKGRQPSAASRSSDNFILDSLPQQLEEMKSQFLEHHLGVGQEAGLHHLAVNPLLQEGEGSSAMARSVSLSCPQEQAREEGGVISRAGTLPVAAVVPSAFRMPYIAPRLTSPLKVE